MAQLVVRPPGRREIMGSNPVCIVKHNCIASQEEYSRNWLSFGNQ